MREIKYLGWDKEHNFIFDVKGITFEGDKVYARRKALPEEFSMEIDRLVGVEAELMQYTDKKDSDKKEIYTGYILECESTREPKYEKRVVCWDSYQAKFKSVPLSTYHANAGNGGWTGYDLYRTKCKVIGNIYEDSELLGD